MRRIAALLFACLVSTPRLAAEEPLVFNHLSVREGLSNNSVYCVLQDHLGFIWFGTFSGLNRYDGRGIEVFRPEAMNPSSISGSIIFDIFEDSRNRLWIATDGGGLNRYIFEDGSFVSYTPDPEKENWIGSQKIFCLEEDARGAVWIGTAGDGLYRYAGESEGFLNMRAADTPGLESDIVRVIVRDRSDRIWVGTQGGGLSVSGSGTGFAQYLGDATVRDIFEDSRNRIWIGLEDGGLLLAVPGEDGFAFRTVVPDQTVRSIAEEPDGTLWIGTDRAGLILLDAAGARKTVRHDPNDPLSLSSNHVREVFADRSGLVWVATRGGGVDRYNPRSRGFPALLRGDYTARQILESPDHGLWIATDGQGLLRIDSGDRSSGSPQLSRLRLPSDHLYSLAEDSAGWLWVGSDGEGLYRIDQENGGVREVYRSDPKDPASLASDAVWALLVDSGGSLWVGTEGGGLSRYLPESDAFVTYRNDPDRADSLLGNSVRTIHEDAGGNLWIGTWDGGLSRKIRGADSFVNYTRDPADPSSISDNSVNCITETTDGLLWIGTVGGGVNLFDPESGTFRAFRENDGLADDNVLGIIPDHSGYLWISTANGLSRLDLVTHQFTNFWRSDGLIADNFNRKAFMRSFEGELFFGTSRGVIRFFPGAVRLNSFQPAVRITGFSLFNEPVETGEERGGRIYLDRDIILSESITVHPGDSFIGFSFVSLDFTNPLKNQYAVRLAGFDSQWHYLGAENSFDYASLPPGDYTLQVMGTNSNGAWSTEIAELAITVLPSFFQTRYFALLIVLGIAGAFYSGVRIRMAGLHRHNRLLRQFSNYVQDVREEERKIVARDVHDELGQLLTTLKMHIFWLTNNAASRQEQRQARYESMLGIINTTLEWSKDLATRLRPVVLDNLSLGEAVEWLLNETRNHTGLHIEHTIDATPPMQKERATSVFRIVQETITNIIRHSGADRALFALRVQGKALCIDIEDNGSGIDGDKLGDPASYGIIGMRERAQHLGGEIAITSTTSGTAIRLRVPLRG